MESPSRGRLLTYVIFRICGVGRWGSLEVERWESTVTGTEGIDMGIGVGFFVDAGSGATVCLSSMTPFPNESLLQLLSGTIT